MTHTALAEAFDTAEKIHADQKYGDKPYMYHVTAVFDVAATCFPDDLVIQVAAILHDALETKPEAEADLRKWHGDEVTDIVLAVTPGPGKNRRERNAVLEPRILALIDPLKGLAVKLCDRKANVTHCYQTFDRRLIMYHKEHAALNALIAKVLHKTPSDDPEGSTLVGVRALALDLGKLLGVLLAERMHPETPR